MAVTNIRSHLVHILPVLGLAAAGIAFHAHISAQEAAPPAAQAAAQDPAQAPAAPASYDAAPGPGVVITRIPKPVTDTGIALAPARVHPVTTPSTADAWGGPRSGSEPTLSDRVVHYRINAALDPVRHTVTGKQKLTWRNRSKTEVRSVYLHLYMNAFANGHSTFYTEKRNGYGGFRDEVETRKGEWGYIDLQRVMQGGARVGYSFVQPDNGPAQDRTVVRLDLPAPVPAGASTTLDIDFLTQLPRVVARTGHADTFHLVAQWYPKMAVLELPGERGATAPRWNAHEHHAQSEFYADFGHFDVNLTVPKGFTVGATGELQGAPLEKNGMLTHRYVQGDVHDFAWTADSRSAAPLQDNWTGIGSPPVKITVIYPPDMAASAAPAMQATKDALSYFSTTLGPYPYKTVTVVIPPFNADAAAGMEYPTFFTAVGKRSVSPGSLDEFDLQFVTIHEFGHNYFQGILGSNELEEPMLDEGLNEYWNHRMLRERKQTIAPFPSFMKALGFTASFHGFDMERLGSPREEPADPIGASAYERLQGIGPAYVRSATMMRDLEARIGKEAMERGMKEYYKRWKFRHPSIADLREALADGSGQRAAVEAVFAQQVYATSKVDDRVDKFSSEEILPQRGMVQVKGKWIEEDQETVDKRIESARKAWKKAHPDARDGSGPFPYRTSVTVRRRGAPVPQVVQVKFADGSSQSVTWNDSARWQRYEFTTAARAVSAQIDPQRMHYLDTSKLDDSRTLKKDASASRRWGGDFAAIVNIFLSMIAAI